jgi:hypothetical protein
MPPWNRDVLWAYQNLDNPEAVPPSALAGRLLALGREHPDRLLACLALVSAEQKTEHSSRGAQEANAREPSAPPPEVVQPRNVKFLCVLDRHLFSLLCGEQDRWVYDIPRDARVVAWERSATETKILILSDTFPAVPEGESLPWVNRELDRRL